MTTAFATFFYKLLVLLMSCYTMFNPEVAPGTSDPIQSVDPQSVQMTAVFWGDSQVSDYLLSRQNNVKAACLDVNNSTEQIDALFHVGDVVENGKGSEYNLILDDFNLINTVDNYLFTVGNHDVRLRAYCLTKKTFNEFRNAVDPKFDKDCDKLYYSQEINGYKVIVLATTRTEFEESYFDDECMAWFESELADGTKDGKPVFVLCHQPLKLTHGLPDTWGSPFTERGSVGEQSDELREIMSRYKNVFFLTGHLHVGFGQYTFEEAEGTHLINVPSVGIGGGDGYEAAGTGFMIEVYEDKVLFRARDFATGVYMPEYDATYTIE